MLYYKYTGEERLTPQPQREMPDYATPENFEAWRQEAKTMTIDA